MKKQRNTILLLSAIVIGLCIVIFFAGSAMWNAISNQTAQQPATDLPAAAAEATNTQPPAEEPTAAEEAPATPTTTPVESEPNPEDIEESDPDKEEETASTVDLPADVLEAMKNIQEEIDELRGLEPTENFSLEILTREELQERVTTEFFTDYSEEEAAEDAETLALIGLLAPGYDLIGMYTDLYSEGVLGYYDDETGEMVVVGSDEFAGPEKMTYAHEYAHAVQNENFDFDEGLLYNEDSCEEDSERCAAIQALIEGEATLIELIWFFEYASLREQQEIRDDYENTDYSAFDSYPSYLREDFAFPYNQGYNFVEALFIAGGFTAIDNAYANPPVSTEQILHPEKYPEDKPIPVVLPDLIPLAGEGWEVLEDNVMGEWFSYLILGHGWQEEFRIDDEQALEAAAGWGGDRYLILINRESDEMIFILKSVWDTGNDKNEFSNAFQAYGEARFGTGASFQDGGQLWEADTGVHIFVETDEATIWIAAPNPNLAQQLYEAIK